MRTFSLLSSVDLYIAVIWYKCCWSLVHYVLHCNVYYLSQCDLFRFAKFISLYICLSFGGYHIWGYPPIIYIHLSQLTPAIFCDTEFCYVTISNIHKTTFKLNDSLEELTRVRKLLYLHLGFNIAKDCRLRSANVKVHREVPKGTGIPILMSFPRKSLKDSA